MDLLVFKLQMEIFNWGVATSIEVKIHNGQGLGIYDGGKLTAIISDGDGSQVGMVGSEWLTSIFTSSITLRVVTNCYNLI